MTIFGFIVTDFVEFSINIAQGSAYSIVFCIIHTIVQSRQACVILYLKYYQFISWKKWNLLFDDR